MRQMYSGYIRVVETYLEKRCETTPERVDDDNICVTINYKYIFCLIKNIVSLFASLSSVSLKTCEKTPI